MTAIQFQNQPDLEQAQKPSPPYLGLVCVTISKQVRFRAMTRTRYLKLSFKERETVLKELYQDNLQRLDAALSFCQQNNIRLYRMTSALFPLSDMEDEIGANILEEMGADLSKIGQKAQALDIRIVLHPDQFVVLSSDSAEIVKTSIKILERHARTFDLLGLPRSPWSLMNIHGGKSQRSAELIKVISELPAEIKNRLTLENDEYAYSSEEILAVCEQTGIPMVFDAHHQICHEKLDSYDDPSVAAMLYAARETWANPDWQLVHISNGETAFKDRKHSNLITAMPQVYHQAPWIEVEAKHKEEAIAHLRSWWLMGQ
ncbi:MULTISPECIES: UV DNA damage repair endonuclease UvsE [Cyanophyceae]|uniref:UV DNA damage repair endonuclease UvsE n=1 Tax=Cyanophyceae TaxID=3028117 RepID=UPI00232B9587|nr:MULTISPECIES: UV DNA damage repair endonuclease UvsE [Cyanophyceae]MDB9354664.1 UV DNA damage repair endonuclease UvsE [Nodularia spumigena CS-587/03]MDB9321649.1 UV DNA damage repair endonuclease UvsE [Nodularia spumigena CS-591/07A]MDB9333249.1 UV DNA damage repair endonuclease UvsE [Nodularia spumigena CS-591/04]MDB9341699.1 UV DNA damage repair endonuclease UvsE [Nodularia spumigena CS-589/07]MDB9358803.1 UV DNA damage repair endonuclease UvsE [Nodularia spumigena CS-588/02]